MPNKIVTIHIPAAANEAALKGFPQIDVTGDGVHPDIKGMVLGYLRKETDLDPTPDSECPAWVGYLTYRVFFAEPFSNENYMAIPKDPEHDGFVQVPPTPALAEFRIKRHLSFCDIAVGESGEFPLTRAVTIVLIGD